MKPTPPRRPRVKLNRDAVWELLGRLGRSQNALLTTQTPCKSPW